MFPVWGAHLYRGRCTVFAVVGVAAAVRGGRSTGVSGHVSQGGYADGASPRGQVAAAAERSFGSAVHIRVVYNAQAADRAVMASRAALLCVTSCWTPSDTAM